MQIQATDEPEAGGRLGLLMVLLAAALISHRLWQVSSNDNSNCQDLITATQKPPPSPWKPSKCPMVTFRKRGMQICLPGKSASKNTSFVFMGDSHQRQIFTQLVTKITDKPLKEIRGKDITAFYPDLNFEAKYYFRLRFNNSVRNTFLEWERYDYLPDLLVINCNLHPILDFNASNDALHEFRWNLTRNLPLLDKIAIKTNVLWYVQPPVKEDILKPSRKMIVNRQVDIYNDMVMQTLRRTHVNLWTTTKIIAQQNLNYYSDDIHVGKQTVELYLQILFNFFCNYKLKASKTLCCGGEELKSRASSDFSPALPGSAVVVLFLLSWVQSLLSTKSNDTGGSNELNKHARWTTTNRTVRAICLTLMAAKCFIYIGFVMMCDRSPFFAKEEKENVSGLVWPVVVSAFLAFRSPLPEAADRRRSVFILEFRGIFTSFILLSSLSVSESSTRKSKFVALYPSVLLFLAGFEAYEEMQEKKKFQILKIYFSKMISQNALACLLCWALEQSYQFYEIMPALFLFNTVSVIFAISFPESKKESYRSAFYDLIKWVFIISITAWISASQTLQSKLFLFSLWKKLFESQDKTIKPWLRTWDKEKYSYSVGVLCAIVLEKLTLLVPETKTFAGFSPAGRISRMSLLFFGISTLGIICVMLWAQVALVEVDNLMTMALMVSSCASLQALILNHWGSYSFVAASLGRLWLEIYVLHLHIWTTNDGTSVLQLFPYHSFVNLCTLLSIMGFVALEFYLFRTSLARVLP